MLERMLRLLFLIFKYRYAQLYFIMWWLISVVICINLFIALVIEVCLFGVGLLRAK